VSGSRGPGVTLAVFPESRTEFYSVRLAWGSGATWHCKTNKKPEGHAALSGPDAEERVTTHFFILSP